MAVAMIWMDSAEAKVFQIDTDKIHVEKVVYRGLQHPAEKLGKNHPKAHSDEEIFFRQLVLRMDKMNFTKLLLMGPGLAVKHFDKFLTEHQPAIGAKVVGVETVDHLPESEILTVGRNIFHKYYLFQGLIA